MKREIKFRVYDVEEKMWSTSFIVDCLKFPSNRIVEISQFTGLTDGNGVEIWEGDILEINHYKINIRWWKNLQDKVGIDEQAERERAEYRTYNLPVVFHDGEFKARNNYMSFDASNIRYLGHKKHDKSHWCDIEEKSWGYVVVGNIYERPDLITE